MAFIYFSPETHLLNCSWDGCRCFCLQTCTEISTVLALIVNFRYHTHLAAHVSRLFGNWGTQHTSEGSKEHQNFQLWEHFWFIGLLNKLKTFVFTTLRFTAILFVWWALLHSSMNECKLIMFDCTSPTYKWILLLCLAPSESTENGWRRNVCRRERSARKKCIFSFLLQL